MSRFSKILLFAALAVIAASCGKKAEIEGTLACAPSSDIVLKTLDVNNLKVIDTVEVDKAGKFSYKIDVEKNQPEFIYIYHNDKKIASLLIQSGDKINVVADTVGKTKVSGSSESEKLMEVERKHAEISAKFNVFSAKYENASEAEREEIVHVMGQEYRNYYMNCTKYVMENSKSLTAIPVLYQMIGELPVFSQSTDAIIFGNLADSLETVYPESSYVKALRADAEQRSSYLELQALLRSAEEIGFPDITLPDLNGQNRTLSSVEDKVILLYFSTLTETSQNRFSVDVLKPIYEKYHDRGFEIYHVSLDVDKVTWATTIMGQDLPWITVCDIRGAQSPYVVSYNLSQLPALFVIADGELVDGDVVDDASLRKLLEKLLK